MFNITHQMFKHIPTVFVAAVFLGFVPPVLSAGAKDVRLLLAGDISQDNVEIDIEESQTPSLSDSVRMEDTIKLRRDLELYSRNVDPSNIQLQERRRLMRKRIQERFLMADQDGDGSISRIEATESLPQIARHFSKVDLNSDDAITVNELATAYDSLIEKQRLDAQKLVEAELAEQKKATENISKSKNKQADNARKRAL